MELSQYNFTVIHRPGIAIPHSDALSRDEGESEAPDAGLSAVADAGAEQRLLDSDDTHSAPVGNGLSSGSVGSEPNHGLSRSVRDTSA